MIGAERRCWRRGWGRHATRYAHDQRNTNGANLSYAYDELNRLSAVTDPAGTTAYGYDNVGNLQTVAYPNTVAHSYSYDSRNRLTSLGVAGPGGQLAGYSYLLDASGHRLSVTELSGRMVSYSYDNLYRLTSESIAADPHAINGTVGYSYDAVGNRKQLTSTLAPVPAGLWNYDANDRFTAGDTYDANGNTTSSGGISDAYDFENRLVQKGGVTIVYDGDGNRVSKTAAGGTTQFLVDTLNPTGYAQVLDEIQNGAVSRTYSWGLELIDQARPQPSAAPAIVNYYVFDGHGSVRALTNATGAVTDTYDYDAFGNLIHSTGTTPNSYLFAGEQFDPDLNLYYNRSRYLNTSTGRFWSMDTFEGNTQDPLSLHKYLYVINDPVNGIDPSGNDFDLGSLATAGAAITTFASATILSFQNVVGAVYINLYKVPEVIETATNYLTIGTGAFEALRFLGTNVLNYAERFSAGPAIRGFQFEEAAGANLGRTFPAFDYYDKDSGTAIQIRSTTQTSSPEALLAVVRKAVNRVNNLPPTLVGTDRAGNPLKIDTQGGISTKGVFIGIPAKPLPWFGTFLQQVRQLSESENVAVTIQFVEGLEGETLEK